MLRGEQLQMRLDFLRQLGVAAPAADKTCQARRQDSQPAHHSCSSMRVYDRQVRSQLSVSAASCFFPFFVIS